MKTKLLVPVLLLFCTSCQFVNRFKGGEAIHLVQSQKFGALNAYNLNRSLFLKKPNYTTLSKMSPDADPTNLEIANNLAEFYGSDHFEWVTKYVADQTYLVAFTDTAKNDGLIWEADLSNQIVKCVSCDAELSKKYHLSADTQTSTKPKHRRRKHKMIN